jgi:hypothetical protein
MDSYQRHRGYEPGALQNLEMLTRHVACTVLRTTTTEERDPEQIRKDLERLELIRKKRWVECLQSQQVVVYCSSSTGLGSCTPRQVMQQQHAVAVVLLLQCFPG